MACHLLRAKLLPGTMLTYRESGSCVNTLRPRQNGRRFTDDIFKCIYLNQNVWIPIKISLKFVPKAPINNILALVQTMAWRRPGDKPLSEPMVVSLQTHICVTRPQWVNSKHGFHNLVFHYNSYGSMAVLSCKWHTQFIYLSTNKANPRDLKAATGL